MLTSLQAAERTQARIDLGARTSCITVAVSLAVVTGDTAASLDTLFLLCALTLAMLLFAMHSGLAARKYLYALVVEGVLASVVIGQGSSAAEVFILYLAAPALIAGLRGGVLVGGAVVAGEALAALPAAVQLQDHRPALFALWLPWLFVAFSVALLGAWIRQLQLLQRDSRSSPYASAHHLLGQLRTVTRELSGGLDIEVVSESVLSRATSALSGDRAALLLRGELGDLSVVAYRGDEAFTVALGQDPLIHRTLTSHRAHQQPEPNSQPSHRFRTCLPLIVGTRVIGVVVVDGPAGLPADELALTQATLDDDALRLESAVLFSDVRALATVEERRRLAREIHDGIAQEIASIGYLVDDLARDECNQGHHDGLTDLRDELTRIVTELRLSIFDLRSGVSSNDGLGSVLGDYVRGVGKSSGMTVHLSLEESPHRLRLDVETELLRIAQEAVTNARKHSHAANMWVTCRVEPPFAEIRIEDDGRGAVMTRDEHYGVHIMKERASRINAVLTVADRLGGGTVVSAVLLPAEVAVHAKTGDSYALHRAAG